jgi:hypothetical protein
MNRFFKYLLWSISIIVILFLSAKFSTKLKLQMGQTYDANPYILFTGLFPILLGMILRLPKIVNTIIQRKRMSLDWIKLITIGVPFLYISSVPYMAMNSFKIYPDFIKVILLTNATTTQIAGLILGYTILDSLIES